MIEQLVSAAQAGDRNAEHELLGRFEGMTRGIASGFFVDGGDRDDVVQEARLGLFKAIRDFDSSAGASFATFAQLCVRRQVVTAVKTARRVKHRSLTEAMAGPVAGEDEDLDILDTLEAANTDPVELLDDRRRALEILRVVRDELSPIERAAIVGRANGDKYHEIEARLVGDGIDRRPPADRAQAPPIKVVDNAIQRARVKIESALARDAAPLGAAA